MSLRMCSKCGIVTSLSHRFAMTAIAEWLASIGLSEYTERFVENAIDFSVLGDLTDQDLKELGILLGHRRKMLRSSLPAGSPYRNALDEAHLDGTKRAEALSWEEWERFYQALRAFKK